MLLEPNPGISIQATSLQSVTLMLNFMHICHSFEISRIIHLHKTSMCGTDSMSRPSIFIGFVMNLRAGRKKKNQKSALGPQNLAPRDHTGDKTVALRLLVSVKEKRITQRTRMASGGRCVLGDKRDYGEQESRKFLHWFPV